MSKRCTCEHGADDHVAAVDDSTRVTYCTAVGCECAYREDSDMTTGLTYSTETITPARAAAEIEAFAHINFRPKSVESHVEMLASEMTMGRWALTGSSIRYNQRGELIDGLNRMRACVLSNCSFTTTVIRGVTDEAEEFIDMGSVPRSVGQLLAHRGGDNVNARTAAGRMILAWQGGILHDSNKQKTRIHPVDVVNFCVDHAAQMKESCDAGARAGRAIKASVKMTTAFHFLASEIDAQAADSFINAYVDGVGLAPGDPVLALRNWTISRIGNRTKTTSEEWAFAFARTWVAFRAGETLKLLKVSLSGRGEARTKLPVMR